MLAAIQRKVEEATLKSKRRSSPRTPAEELDSMSDALMRKGREPERLTPAVRAREIRIAKVANQLRAWAKGERRAADGARKRRNAASVKAHENRRRKYEALAAMLEVPTKPTPKGKERG